MIKYNVGMTKINKSTAACAHVTAYHRNMEHLKNCLTKRQFLMFLCRF